MIDKAVLFREIETLPASYLDEVLCFVEYVKRKQGRNPAETMMLSESTLAKDWDSPEENAAWAGL
jgi:hypothetical protein